MPANRGISLADFAFLVVCLYVMFCCRKNWEDQGWQDTDRSRYVLRWHHVPSWYPPRGTSRNLTSSRAAPTARTRSASTWWTLYSKTVERRSGSSATHHPRSMATRRTSTATFTVR